MSNFEILCKKILTVNIVNMVHLVANASDDINGEIVQTTSLYFRINKFQTI